MLIQTLSLAIFLFIIICSFINYKKTAILWLSAQLLFNAQVALRYEPPAMSLQIAVNAFLLFFFFIKSRGKKNGKSFVKETFPLWHAFILILLSFILSSIFGNIGTFKGLTSAIKYFITDIGTVYLAFRVLKTEKDLSLFVRGSAVVFSIIILLGITEFILKDNLWADFVYFNSPHADTTEGRMYYIPPALGGEMEIRYGLVRAMSTFGIHIQFGVASLMYFWLFLLMLSRKYYYASKCLTIFFAFFIVLGVFLCNSKTGMVGLVFVFMSIYKFKDLIDVKIVFSIILGILILIICVPDYLLNFISLFDSDIAQEGGGSTVIGRQRQFEVALNMFAMNPLFGNGIGSISELSQISDNYEILGAESVWMQILPERGLFGAYAYCMMYFFYYKGFIRNIPKKILIMILLATLVMSTATGEISQVFWGIVLVAANRMFYNRKIIRTSTAAELIKQ